MLFDPVPKTRREDFFDREEEIEKVKSLLSPITLILGLRRTGKSSLIKISLNELKHPYLYVDLRKFEEKAYVNYKDFILEIQEEVNKLTRKFPEFLNFVKRIKGVKIMGNEVYFSWESKSRVSFSSILDSLDEWAEDKVILVLDEAQELHKMRGFNILPSLAYAFDNLRKVKILLSGSQMGLLLKFLKLEDPESPLFGRALSRVELKPFSREEVIEFLRKGFNELKVDFRDYEKVYEELGGIPGWLTYFGLRYYETRDFNKAITETLDYAKRLILSEFEHFLLDKAMARVRYYTVMRSVAECNNWSGIKNALEAKEGVRISDSELSNYLNHLLTSSWLVKLDDKYCPSEPLIGKAFKTR